MKQLTKYIIILLSSIFLTNCQKTKGDDIEQKMQENINIINSEFSKDFDFLIGEWKIHNKILKERLSENADEWMEFNSANTKVWKQLNGMLIVDEFNLVMNGKPSVGNNYRFYNPTTKEWKIYWASTAYPELGVTYQVTGMFKNGIGEFFGEEYFNNQKVKLRFLWTKNIKGNPHWEQAYFDDKNNKWETNWIMDFRPKK